MTQNPNDFMNDFNKFGNELKSNLKVIFGIIIGVVALAAVSSIFYQVEPDEEAVVLRLGKYTGTTQPGLHYKLPFGIDKVVKVKTRRVHQAEFGFRTRNVDSVRRTTYSTKNFDLESLMLTGDLNVADVEWVVHFQISDPYKFLFKTNDPTRNVRDVSESIMRRVVGDRLVTEVLTTGRSEIASEAKTLVQQVVDKYDMGVSIVTVKLQDVNPPDVVKPSFNEVNEAKQEQEKVINQAEEAYNRVIPEAKGKAKQIITEAEGYARAVVNRAKGDADSFLSRMKEYRRAPQITRKRIYLETMEQIYSNLEGMTIVDPKVKGVLPVYSKLTE